MLVLVETSGLLGVVPDGFRRELETLQFFHANIETDYTVKAFDLHNWADHMVTIHDFDISIVVGDNPDKLKNCPIPCVWMPMGVRKPELAEHACGVIVRNPAEQKALECESTVIRPVVHDYFNLKHECDRTLIFTEAPYGYGPHLEVIDAAKSVGLPVQVAGFPVDWNLLEKCGDHGSIRPTPAMLRQSYWASKIFVCSSNKQRNAAYEALACGCRVLAHESVLIGGTGITTYSDDLPEQMAYSYGLEQIETQPTGNPKIINNYLKSIIDGLVT